MIKITDMFTETEVRPILKRHFKSIELIERINEMVYFLPFTRQEIFQLVNKELEFWAKKAKQTHNIDLTWDTNVTRSIADECDHCYGARSIKHEVEKKVVTELALAQEKGKIKDGSKVRLIIGGSKKEPVIELDH